MATPARYKIDRTRIIFEQFEDETVLVNTETGFYYSLSNSGSEILRLLEKGCDAGDLPQALFGQSQDAHQCQNSIESFVAKLVDEEIIVATNAEPGSSCESEQERPLHYDLSDYLPPVLERFDEVRELLLIDPVHQVDQEYGWPKASRDGSAPGPSNHEQ